MKITLESLRKLVKEELEGEELAPLLRQVIGKLEDIDASIDYLSAAMTDQDPLGIQIGQTIGGRHVSPPSRKKDPRDVD